MFLRFVTSVYGNRHVNMLLPLLYSIEKSNPQAKISVYWEEIESDIDQMLHQVFPKVEFIATNFKLGVDITQRISSKTLFWEFASQQYRGETICFLDADTLVVNSLKDILDQSKENKSEGFDILITDKKHHFPINSGVMLIRNSKKVSRFLTRWRQKTQLILRSRELYDQANSKYLPYGGADQMALHHLLNYRYGTTNYAISQDKHLIKVHTIDCKYLNETESRPVTTATHIIHYKGGWRPILFEGGHFTKLRSKRDSWPMFIRYIETFQEAVAKVNKVSGRNYRIEDFDFSIPFYLDRKTLKERTGLYIVFHAFNWLRLFPKRVVLITQQLQAATRLYKNRQ